MSLLEEKISETGQERCNMTSTDDNTRVGQTLRALL
jgi:hypothetical protein